MKKFPVVPTVEVEDAMDVSVVAELKFKETLISADFLIDKLKRNNKLKKRKKKK